MQFSAVKNIFFRKMFIVADYASLTNSAYPDGTPLSVASNLDGTEQVRVNPLYCKFGKFREGFIFAKLRICEVS